MAISIDIFKWSRYDFSDQYRQKNVLDEMGNRIMDHEDLAGLKTRSWNCIWKNCSINPIGFKIFLVKQRYI